MDPGCAPTVSMLSWRTSFGTVDGDCLETDHCVWGNCETKGFYCMTDADCGDYMMCAQGGRIGSSNAFSHVAAT